MDPLASVVGSTKSKQLLLSLATSYTERNRLQELGCLLGINDWSIQVQSLCQPPAAAVERITPEEAVELIVEVL